MAIQSFQHKGLQRFFELGSKAGIQAVHADKISRQLARLNVAAKPEDMNVPGWAFHSLKGKAQGRYALSVNGNWRLTFAFDGIDVEMLDYEDYH